MNNKIISITLPLILSLIIIMTIFYSCGDNTGVIPQIPSQYPGPTPADPGKICSFTVTINVPVTKNARVIPWQKKWFKVSVTHISGAAFNAGDIDISEGGTYTSTVNNIPVGLNTALLQIQDINNNILAQRKYPFLLEPNTNYTAGEITPISMGVGIYINNGEIKMSPSNIDIPKDTVLWFQNQTTACGITINVDQSAGTTIPASITVPAATEAIEPITPSAIYVNSITFNNRGTFSYTSSGTNVTNGKGSIRVYSEPIITVFTPDSANTGDRITINGTDFIGSDIKVYFGGIQAGTVTIDSDTGITASVPENAITGKISVTAVGGSGQSSTNFFAPPAISGFNPGSGPVGTAVTITGRNFEITPADNTVKFNDAAVTDINVASPSAMTVTVPEGASTGKITIKTTSNNVIGSSLTDFTITPSWKTVGNPGFSSDQAAYTSIAMAPDNVSYVTYADYGYGNKATVMKWDNLNKTWSAIGGEGFSNGATVYNSIAIDPNGIPYVVYQDGSKGNKATVKRFYGGTWQTVGNAGFSTSAVNYTSIAIAPNGIPYVGYAIKSGKAYVMKYNGTAWETVGIGDKAYYTSIAIAPNGTPYLVYEITSGSHKAIVYKFEGTWQAVGASTGFSNGKADYTSIAIAPSGIPYVIYMDGSTNPADKATVMKYNGTNWEPVGNTGFSDGKVQLGFNSIAIDKDGVPYVVYGDSNNKNKATVMKYNGTWETVGNAGFSAGVINYPSIAVDKNGIPYVVYMDGTNGKATVMKFSL